MVRALVALPNNKKGMFSISSHKLDPLDPSATWSVSWSLPAISPLATLSVRSPIIRGLYFQRITGPEFSSEKGTRLIFLGLLVGFCLVLFEIRSSSVAQAGLRLSILMSQPPEF